MTPTSQLRFVERLTTDPSTRILRILQQWWVVSREAKTPDGEWRDVPVEKEST